MNIKHSVMASGFVVVLVGGGIYEAHGAPLVDQNVTSVVTGRDAVIRPIVQNNLEDRSVGRRSPQREPTARELFALYDSELTPEAKELVAKRLAAYRDHMLRTVKTKSQAIKSGINKERDAIEYGPKQFVAPAWGSSKQATKAEIEKAPKVDPLLLDEVSGELAETLGRAPTAKELNAKLAAYDAETARLNADLEKHRAILARYYKAQRYSKAWEVETHILDKYEPQQLSEFDNTQEKLDVATRTELGRRLTVTMANRLARELKENREAEETWMK